MSYGSLMRCKKCKSEDFKLLKLKDEIILACKCGTALSLEFTGSGKITKEGIDEIFNQKGDKEGVD